MSVPHGLVENAARCAHLGRHHWGTTYGISLLTDTIHGSNFAIPSTENPPRGNGAVFERCEGREQSGKNVEGAKPEVTWRPPTSNKASAEAGKPKSEARFFVRWPSPRSSPGDTTTHCKDCICTCQAADQGTPFLRHGSQDPRSPQHGKPESAGHRVVGSAWF
jgi:hypothetical protein